MASSSSSSSSSLSSSSAAPTPAGYFAALLTTLEGTLARNETSLNEGDILPATLYLLSIVVLFVPPALLRSQCPTLLPLLTPLLPYTNPHAPSLRSLITILGAFISSLDSHSLDAPGVRNGFSTLVERTIDPRPKVRRKAAEAVRDILSKPPPLLQAQCLTRRRASQRRSSTLLPFLRCSFLDSLRGNILTRSPHAYWPFQNSRIRTSPRQRTACSLLYSPPNRTISMWTKRERRRATYSMQSLQPHHQSRTPNLHRIGSAS